MDVNWPAPRTVLPLDAAGHLWLDAAESEGDAVQVCLGGELDFTTVKDLAGWIELLQLNSRERLVIDLSALTFCDAAGLSALARLHGTLRSDGRQLILRTVPDAVRRIMALTGDERHLNIA